MSSNASKVKKELKPEPLALLWLKFLVYVAVVMASACLDLSFWPLIQARLSASPDWFLAYHPEQANLSVIYLLLIMLGIGAGVILLRYDYFRRVPDLPQRRWRLGLRLVALGAYAVLLTKAVGVDLVRDDAWKAYGVAITAAQAELRPGMSAAQAEARFNALRMSASALRLPAKGSEVTRSLTRHSDDGSQLSYRVKLTYDQAGLLTASSRDQLQKAADI